MKPEILTEKLPPVWSKIYEASENKDCCKSLTEAKNVFNLFDWFGYTLNWSSLSYEVKVKC